MLRSVGLFAMYHALNSASVVNIALIDVGGELGASWLISWRPARKWKSPSPKEIDQQRNKNHIRTQHTTARCHTAGTIDDPIDGRLGGTIDDPIDGRRHKTGSSHTRRDMRGSSLCVCCAKGVAVYIASRLPREGNG